MTRGDLPGVVAGDSAALRQQRSSQIRQAVLLDRAATAHKGSLPPIGLAAHSTTKEELLSERRCRKSEVSRGHALDQAY